MGTIGCPNKPSRNRVLGWLRAIGLIMSRYSCRNTIDTMISPSPFPSEETVISSVAPESQSKQLVEVGHKYRNDL